jgi:predicted DNA-binding transcriptional regulator YafY
MPREWIAELAGEPATFPTYRKRSARLTGQTTQVDLRLQLLLLQIPRVLIVEPKSIQASVRTQVDLVLQLVQVFVV